MSITRILSTAALIVFVAAVANDAPAGVLGDILTYVSGYPSDDQTLGNYPQYNSTNRYQYHITYHGPATNQSYPQTSANPYGQYAAATPTQGYTGYQQNVPQATVRPASRGVASRTEMYPQQAQRRVAVNRNRSAKQVQAQRRTTYRQPSPPRQQVNRPYGYSWQPSTPYYGSYAPQQTQAVRSSYYTSPYQYNNQGWYSGGFCAPGRS